MPFRNCNDITGGWTYFNYYRFPSQNVFYCSSKHWLQITGTDISSFKGLTDGKNPNHMDSSYQNCILNKNVFSKSDIKFCLPKTMVYHYLLMIE